jgi:glycosyltransferase involved in cell wall biosynthesis
MTRSNNGSAAPVVSVLVSAYNAAPFVLEAVESILGQSLQDFEVLVVDDGSTDGTDEVVDGINDPRIRAWRQENKGKAAALNFMVSQARGQFLAIQDADDASHPSRLASLVGRLQAEPELGAVFSGHWLLIDGELVAPSARRKSSEECRRDIENFRMPAHDPTMVCRTEIARELLFDTGMPVGQQFDFILRLGEKHPMAVLGEPLYYYRVHEASITRARADLRGKCVCEVLNAARVRRGLDSLSDEERSGIQRRAISDPTNNLIGHFIDSVYLQRLSGDWRGAARTALASINACPLSLGSMKPLVYAFGPWPIVDRIRNRRSGPDS